MSGGPSSRFTNGVAWNQRRLDVGGDPLTRPSLSTDWPWWTSLAADTMSRRSASVIGVSHFGHRQCARLAASNSLRASRHPTRSSRPGATYREQCGQGVRIRERVDSGRNRQGNSSSMVTVPSM